MEVIIPNYFQNIEEKYGVPLYSVHRVDLHNQLKMLATQKDGLGYPADIHVRAKVVDYVRKWPHLSQLWNTDIPQDTVQGKVILADNKVLQADLIVAADGLHSTAVGHVLDNEETPASNTGWACLRWLVPTEELLSDSETASLVEDSVQRYYMGAPGAGFLVWYPCRKSVISLPFRACLLLTELKLSNEIQNFLYLSQAFDSSHAKEGTRCLIL